MMVIHWRTCRVRADALLWQDLVEEVLRFAFLLQVGLRAFLHQVLQVVGVLLHPGQQVVEDAGAALPVEEHRNP